MAVLIEGINRPTEPRKCKFFDIDPLGVRKPFCAIQSVCDGLEFCPLIEVPKHWDLIDRDALMKKLNNCMFPSDMVTTTAVSMATNWINEAPTVIEAEDGE